MIDDDDDDSTSWLTFSRRRRCQAAFKLIASRGAWHGAADDGVVDETRHDEDDDKI